MLSAMRRVSQIFIGAAAVLATVRCGGSSAAPSSTTSALRADIADPPGDALADARVPASPDIVRVTADVTGATITWVVQLRSGTLDRQTTRVTIDLDTDQNASTGNPQWNTFGADYAIDLNPNAAQAIIVKADPPGCAAHLSCFTPVDSVPLTVGTDRLQANVPLSLLGQDDGRMNFWLGTNVLVAGQFPSSFVDVAPDRPDAAPGRVQ